MLLVPPLWRRSGQVNSLADPGGGGGATGPKSDVHVCTYIVQRTLNAPTLSRFGPSLSQRLDPSVSELVSSSRHSRVFVSDNGMSKTCI